MNVKCKCGVNLLQTPASTIVCPVCGTEKAFLKTCDFTNCGFQSKHAPFLQGYSRSKRFKQMVDMLLFPASANADGKVLEYLTDRKHLIHDLKDIIDLLSKSKFHDKRFCSLHLFSRLFNPKYKKPPFYGNLFHMIERMVRRFQMIELRYKLLSQGKPFINYTYITRFVLEEMGFLYYLQFVKLLKCAKRRKRYKKMLESFCLNGQFSTVHIHV